MATTPVKKVWWKARSLYKSLKERMPREREVLQESLREIRSAAQDNPPTTNDLLFYTGIIGHFELCARVYAWEGLVGLMDGDENTSDCLYQATYYEVAANRLLFALYLYPSETSLNIRSFNDFALVLARAVAIGCWREAEELAKILCAGLADIRTHRNERVPTYAYRHSYFGATNSSCVAPFILHLYSQATGTQLPLEHLNVNPLSSMQAYEPLLHLWQTTDVDALEQALLPACDLHLRLSKPQTNVRTPEFSTHTDMLYPAEFLMLLRLRETAGLTTPTFDHPLLNAAVGRLYPIRDVPHDSDLDKALANGLRAIPILRSTRPTP
jgi:hypothetical protein